MKCLRRNRVPFWYCLFDLKEELLDEDGNRTGEYAVYYKPPVEVLANVSAAHGEVQEEMFGRNLSYDKVIVLDDPSCPIDEDAVLFVDKPPDSREDFAYLYDSDGNLVRDSDGEPVGTTVHHPLFDYIVKRAARTLNTVAYAIERVTVT